MSRRSDPVTTEVVRIVLDRERAEMARVLGRPPQGPICAAPVIDPEQWGKCSGRTTFDHIHPHAGGTKSKRARSIPEELVALCQGHTEDGMKAGHQWNTAHRPEIRGYIIRTTRRCIRCDAVVIGDRCGFCGLPVTSTAVSRAEGITSAAKRQLRTARRQRAL